MIAVQRVTGTMTRLPLSRSGDGSPTSAASEGDPALLDAFVRAATHHEREPR
jgi:xylulokinase